MVTRALLIPLLSAMILSAVTCDAKNRLASQRRKPPAESTTKSKKNIKIKLRLQDKTVTATLNDTPTARDFASMLPLTLTLEDYAKTEKISDLPRKLRTEGAPAGADPSVGDIAYYAPWGNLALYYRDFRYSDGLILLGKLDRGAEGLSVPGSLKVTIELVRKEKPK